MTVAKMLIHIGSGEDRKTYEFDEDRLMNVEGIAIERATGKPLLEVILGLNDASVTSLSAILWVLRRREEPGLQFEDVQFFIKDVDVDQVEEQSAPKEEPSGEPAPN